MLLGARDVPPSTILIKKTSSSHLLLEVGSALSWANSGQRSRMGRRERGSVREVPAWGEEQCRAVAAPAEPTPHLLVPLGGHREVLANTSSTGSVDVERGMR